MKLPLPARDPWPAIGYSTVPRTSMESHANVRSVSRQITGRDPNSDVYDDGFLRVEHRNFYIACGGVSLKLPRKEFLLVSRLAQSPNRIVTSEDLWTCAWGDAKSLNPESLHVHIYRLRNKLLPFGVTIETMVNVGYKLTPRIKI